jgi:hypothetical protein
LTDRDWQWGRAHEILAVGQFGFHDLAVGIANLDARHAARLHTRFFF